MPPHPVPALATAHFTFTWYDEAGTDALTNLTAVAGTAEYDLAALAGIFDLDINDTWGPIDVRTNLPGGGASNSGYGPRGLNMSSPARSSRSDPLVDELMRALFVMELAEILMDYRNLTVAGAGRWNAGDSAGEGLSRVLGYTLRREGFLAFSPRTTWMWIDAGGPDWVTSSYPSDVEGSSLACSFLFLCYLHSQLGHSWQQIVTAEGITLAQKYRALGGDGDGFLAMTSLLLEFFTSIDGIPDPPDDVFPLWTDGRRSVQLSVADRSLVSPAAYASSEVTVSPGGLCPPGRYHYGEYDLAGDLVVSAAAFGFGLPSFEWTINGVAVPDGAGPISVTATLLPVDPAAPDPGAVPDQPVDLVVSFTSMGPDSAAQLTVRCATPRCGSVVLSFGVLVGDTFVAAGGVAVASAHALLPTQRLVYEDRYGQDAARCLDALRKRLANDKVYRLPPYLVDFRPDPDPTTRAAGTLIASLREAAAGLRKADPQGAPQLISALASAHGLPSSLLES